MEAIGIDLGGTKIEAGRIDSSGNVLQHLRVKTDAAGGPKAIENQIQEAVLELQKGSNVPLAGVGIGVAGQIDPHTGVVYFAPNLPDWHNVPLRANLENALRLKIKIVNDVRAITIGEWLFGAGKGVQDLVCVFVGTGIGGGVVSGGTLLTGCSNTFGEVGHMTIDLYGPVCTCGNRGCWESIAGGWGIAKYARECVIADRLQGARVLELANNEIDKITAKTVVEAYWEDDHLAKIIIEHVKTALIAGCVSLVNLYNPERLILGGGFLDGMPDLIPLIDIGIRQFALKAATKSLEIVPAKLGKQVGVIGAASVVLKP